MNRFIDEELLNWSKKEKFKPLLLRGARQVGKTFAVRKLGQTFENFVEINFEFKPELKSIFKRDLDPHRIIRDITSSTLQTIIPGKTLLFFDEVQAEPQIIIALRYFYELIPELHVIAAGSLLDFAIESVGVPVGRVQFIYMYPMTFAEFLGALGAKLLLNEILNHDISKPISNIVHDSLLRYVGQYLAIGGMPEVVYSWSKKQDPLECFALHQNLIASYKQDFGKYAKRSQVKYLDILFGDIPRQLGKKFKYSKVPGEFKKRELFPALELLATSGVITKVYHTDAHGLPLGAQVDPEDFKVVFLDVALAQAVLGLNLSDWFLNPEQQFINRGEIVEAFIGQEILAYSNPIQKSILFYWQNQKRGSEAEVDYVVSIGQNVIPIEVKSGHGSTLKSMHIFLANHPESKKGIRFSSQNYSIYDKIYSYPLYSVAAALSWNKKIS